jgi:hypothetical protein
MTSLQERMDLKPDRIDRAAEHADVAFVLGDNDSDVRAMPHQAALLDVAALEAGATLDEPRRRSTAFVRMLLDGVRATFARSSKRPKRQRKHYPPRFSLEFETSLVDRERRRL